MTSQVIAFFISVIIITSGVHGMIEEINMDRDVLNCYDSFRRTSDITRTIGYSVHWKCMQMHIWKLLDNTSLNITVADQKWIESITDIPEFSGSQKTQSQMPRVRREYRRMTNQERDNYHRAVNLLKQMPVCVACYF